ncbi:putative ABC transporter permease [Galbitalea sp. SE-J8]|uniref:putative ABC transporter permease n=1 Tax=Galbitalea sp. SE-J8 TaxID=3054952 RepID=UPI00259C750A|nr:putative ABC transporter permease [Galbitalea sp. SE-J8]MDM4761981.1 putative ABC transporter permease [Galbitalea sp. SE-J8]
MNAFALLLLYLAAYSFLGWVAEVGFVLVVDGRLQNRGFLTGPFVPIYGFGALALVYIVSPYITNPFLVFVASVVISSALEYATHFALDKAFHIRLWDYSNERHNLHGRICLRNSLLFGMLGLLLLYVIHPLVASVLTALAPTAAIAIAFTLFGILLIDAANSIRSLAKVRPVLDRIDGTLAQAHDRIQAAASERHQTSESRREAGDAAHRGTIARIARAFPGARSNEKGIPG